MVQNMFSLYLNKKNTYSEGVQKLYKLQIECVK